MKFKGFVFFAFAALFSLVAANQPKTDEAQKEAILMQTVLAGLEQLHYAPYKIDDEFSNKVFDLYLERIDGNKRWLTQADVNQLAQYKDQLDDQAKGGTFEFLNLSEATINKSLVKTKAYYQEFLAQPFDFTGKETIELDGDKKAFAKDDAELKMYWEKAMKYETLTRLVNKIEAQEKAKKGEKQADKSTTPKNTIGKVQDLDGAIELEKEAEEEVKIKTVAELEEESRKAVLKLFNDWYHRMEKRQRKNFVSDYLNSFTSVFDPHTNYFLPADKENFDIGMSGRLEGIGARLQETPTDETKVVMVVPGGPAYNGKILEVEDIILKVAQDDDGDWIDIAGWDINDVVAKIRGKKGTKVRLAVKKVDGSIVETTIIRDEIIMDEGYAKSAVLDLEEIGDNIGYIKLPRFYADFNKRDGHQCAIDVGIELEKLKKQKVNGIILDLRSNGGGSLRDVVDMSGFFIEEGPIVQVKSRRANAEVLNDKDPSVQYDGPLIVMVNSFSASASEILAAALQDYDRAVIVGSDATFGKATVQRFFDLDRAIRGYSDIKPLGQVKVTTQKFYRITGNSNQLEGVIPDIMLPDNYDLIKTGEQEYETAMKQTKIEPVTHTQGVFQVKNKAALKTASEGRVANNEIFQKIQENAKRLKKQRESTSYSLNMDNFRKHKTATKAEADKYKNLMKPIEGLTVSNLAIDLAQINTDSSKIGRNDAFIKALEKDVYIEETLHIMKDLVKGSTAYVPQAGKE
ncbi:MAG: carboxy terminal-processing peptidase [Saprospiraceae bacterium]